MIEIRRVNNQKNNQEDINNRIQILQSANLQYLTIR